MGWNSNTLQIGKPHNQFSLAVPQPTNLNILALGKSSQIEWHQQGKPICVVTKEGRVTKDDIDITDNDEAMANCFIELLKKHHGIEVKRGSS